MTRKIFLNFMMAIGGLIGGLLIAELLLMVFKPQPVYVTEAPRIFFIRHDPLLGWANLEGAEGVYDPHTAMPKSYVKINQQGYRGELLREKKTGRQRVLFLGGSHTFGLGVDEIDRYSNLIVTKSKGSIEQINLGVVGYSPDMQALQLESKGMSYHPDSIVVAVSAGDLSDVMNSVSDGSSKPFFKFFGDRLMVQNAPVPEKSFQIPSNSMSSALKKAAYQYSHLYRFALARISPLNKYTSNSVVEMSEGDALNVMTALLTGMRDISVENKLRFYVVLIPNGMWLESLANRPGEMPGYFSILRKLLLRNGITLIDSAEQLLRSAKEGQELFFDKDPVHLNAYGHRIIAEVVYPYLVSSQ